MPIADYPFLQPGDITYEGAFRVPYTRTGSSPSLQDGQAGCYLAFGGNGLCYNPTSGGLFMSAMSTEKSALVEISIPSNPSTSSNRLDLPQASIIQPARRFDPELGRSIDIPAWQNNPAAPGFEHFELRAGGWGSASEVAGILFYGGDLYITMMGYYDATGLVNKSHCRMVGTNLATGDFDALSLVQVPTALVRNGTGADMPNHHAGHVAQNMQHVPPEWRAELGNMPCITGSNGYAVVSRTGSMPSAMGFDPASLNPTTPASSLLYQHGYPSTGSSITGQAYPNPGDPAYGSMITTWHGPPSPNAWYRATNFDRAFIPVPGTRSVIDWHVGSPREAWVIYGNGVTVAQPQAPHPLAGQTYNDSVIGVSGNGYYGLLPGASTYTQLSGTGAYERTFRLFDADNWRRTYQGSLAQDAATPYAEKVLNVPIGHPNTRYAGGGTIDPVNKKIYVCDTWGDNTGVSFFPLIHVYSYVIPGSGGGSGPSSHGTVGDRAKIGYVSA